MLDIGIELVMGVITSIIAAIIISSIVKTYKKEVLERKKLRKRQTDQIEIGKKFLDQGLTKFHFSRDDYGRTLATFINSATQSISIVSISLKNTDDEGCLTDIFKRKLCTNRNFTVTISLMNPNNSALINSAADTLNVKKDKLLKEVTEMLSDLLNCYNSLNPSEKSRFKILVHDCFPMGSVIMLDASPSGGMIQIETKLYKAPRASSFGFQLTKKSPFFKHNFEAWQRVLRDSKPFTKD